MPRPLVVYFKDELWFHHPRRVYIAATTKKRAHEISGFSVASFDKNWCKQLPAGAPEVPPFIQGEGVWLEIRDQDAEGHIEASHQYDTWGGKKARKHKAPTNEAAFIKAGTLEACKEAFTLRVDRALAAAGVPREDL